MASVPDSASVPSAERERGIEKTDELRRLKNARNRKFESISLQERVHCELDHDVELAVDVEITWHEQIAEEIERASEPGVDTAPRGRGIVCQVICQLMGTVSVA
jgi:hypothetical protein